LYHHRPQLDPDRARVRTLSAVVHVANAVAHTLGVGCDKSETDGTGDPQSVLEAIGWPAPAEELAAAFRTEFAGYDQSLNA
jgi:hypothetical protein